MNEHKGFSVSAIKALNVVLLLLKCVLVSLCRRNLRIFFFGSMLGSVNLTSVSVKGVAAALEKHTPKGESKGIKAYFRMDENGILNLEKVRYMYYSSL